MDTQAQNTDTLLPFLIDESNLRGRMVRLHESLNTIIDAHDYPPSVQGLLAEALTLTTQLGTMLKFDGIFTLQVKGDGIVPTLVCDITTSGNLRGYAGIDQDKFDQSWQLKKTKPTARDLLGDGHIAFTVDQGAHMERYQALVELNGNTLLDCVHHYFAQSEQITTALKIHTERNDKGWQSGAIMLQKLPEQDSDHRSNINADDWQRAMILLDTVKEAELIGNDKTDIPTILYRLFHEDGVRIYDPLEIQAKCRCARENVVNTLTQFSAEALADYIRKDGTITMDCQFCNTQYVFTGEEIKNIQQLNAQT